MIGHVMLWRCWNQTRQQAAWARELSVLRDLEPEVIAPRVTPRRPRLSRTPGDAAARRTRTTDAAAAT